MYEKLYPLGLVYVQGVNLEVYIFECDELEYLYSLGLVYVKGDYQLPL